MACHLVGAKPLSQPMLSVILFRHISFQLKSWNQLFGLQLLLFQSFRNCTICANSWVFHILNGNPLTCLIVNWTLSLFGILTVSFKKIYLKGSSLKWRPFCLGLSVLEWPERSCKISCYFERQKLLAIILSGFSNMNPYHLWKRPIHACFQTQWKAFHATFCVELYEF